MCDETDESRLGRIEGKLNFMSEFVTNHLSKLPEEMGIVKEMVGHIRGRTDVLIPISGASVVALVILLVKGSI